MIKRWRTRRAYKELVARDTYSTRTKLRMKFRQRRRMYKGEW